MATRKTSSQKIDAASVAAIAMRQIKTKADYDRILAVNTPEVITDAWTKLSIVDQDWISNICNASPQTDINAIANELATCGTINELRTLKAFHGEDAVKAAWKLISVSERNRIKALCHNVQKIEEKPPVNEQPQHQDSSEIPNTYPENVAKVDVWLEKEGLTENQHKPRTLFSISDDLEKLNDLLDEVSNDVEQQELITQWLETLGDERDRKLDSYAALITEMSARAEVRKAEAKRLMELASVSENRVKLLKARLKSFFETHNLKTVETARYKLSIAKNGGKAPLILDETTPATQLPERFQKISVDPDTNAIRDALERGEKLGFAQLGERGTSLRIK